MSNAKGMDGVVEKTIRGCKDVFWRASESEINASMPDDDSRRPDDEDDPYTAPPARSDGSSNNDRIEPGRRSPPWYERIEKLVQENRSRSIQNRNLLGKIDNRTVWIARLLIGILVTVIGGVILEVFIIGP